MEDLNEDSTNHEFSLSFERAAIGLAHVDLKGRFIRVNQCLCNFLGYPKEELLDLTFQELSLAEELEESILWIRSILADEISQDFSKIKRYRHKDGHLVWAKLTTTLIRDFDNEPLYFISSIQDISELKRTEDLLRESEQKLKTIIEAVSSEVAIWMTTDDMLETLYVNQGFEKLWEQSAQALFNNPLCFLKSVHPEDLTYVENALENTHTKGIDYRLKRPDGLTKHVHMATAQVKEKSSRPFRVFSAVDRTELIIRQQKLERASRQDALTKVLNRNAFNDHLRQALEHFNRYNTAATLIFIDLDDFKQVNDTYGHLVGDNCLIELARTLRSSVRKTDLLGRYGGDEFVVLLNNSIEHDAEEFINRVGDRITLLIEEEQKINVGISYGVHQLTREIESIDQWIDHADHLMYQSKLSTAEP